jgi:hypothetical protein
MLMNTLKAWIPIIITVGTAAVAALTPTATAFWGAHPTASIILAGVWGVVKGLMPSPIKG